MKNTKQITLTSLPSLSERGEGEEEKEQITCPNCQEIYFIEHDCSAEEIKDIEPNIPEEPECGEDYGDDGCPGDIEPDFIICEICGKELEDAEEEHDCHSNVDGPCDIDEIPEEEEPEEEK